MNLLRALLRDYRSPDTTAQARALRGAFHLGLGALVLPGVVLGLLRLAFPAAPHTGETSASLTVLAAAFAGLALRLASRSLKAPHKGQDAALTAALQLGTAPAVPALLALAFLGAPWTALGCGLVALAAYLAARGQLPAGRWAR